MTVRLRIALTILATGLLSALGVIVTVALAFQRFEHESTYERANAFLGRVVAMYDDMLDLHDRNPQDFGVFLKSLLLFEPDTQLYLLAADGRVLASTGQAPLAPGFKVTLAPVQRAAQAVQEARRAPYVMGDDPEHMNADAVIGARALHRSLIRPAAPVAGYLYLVAQKPSAPGSGLALFRSSLAGPALAAVLAVIVLATALAAWIIAGVTRPLRVLSDEVAAASLDGFGPASGLAPAADPFTPAADAPDEFGQLRAGFRTLLARLRAQWDQLRQLDHFRREGVSNLSHDLRSPLTATVACLETLDQRWAGEPARADDRRLVEVALRNSRNAAQLVRSLGDLALLDEPEFRLHLTRLDVGEVLDDITLRFAERVAQQGITLHCEVAGPAVADVDIELFERAVANLVDNALKFTPSEGRITLAAAVQDGEVRITVSDSGAGIAPRDLAHLFDRLYQGRERTAPATGEGGKGLGLAIVRRIAELHQGRLEVTSRVGEGTCVLLALPAAVEARLA